MGGYSITWDAFEMISVAQYPSRWRVAYLISVVQKSCVRAVLVFSIMRLDSTAVPVENPNFSNEKLRTTLGFCGFRGKFLECVSLTLLFVVEIVSNKSPKTKPNRSTIYRTVARIGARYKVFHGSAHFVANSWPRFLLSVIISRSPQRPRHQRVSCYIYILICLISWYRTTVLCCCRPSGGKRTSLSVLSPFDEAEEWSKILEILNTCNSGLDPSEDGTGGDGGCDDSHLLGAVQREFQNRLGE